MGAFTETITINQNKETIWNALADIGSIDKWNPGVVRSYTTTDSEIGLGSGRRCELGGKNYLNEEVVEWNPGDVLTMRIVGTNLPFVVADIRFKLEARGKQTTVSVAPEYTLKFGFLGKLMDALMVRSQYRKGMKNLLKGLQQYVEGQKA